MEDARQAVAVDREATRQEASLSRRVFVAGRAFALTLGLGAGTGAAIGYMFDRGDQDLVNGNHTALTGAQDKLATLNSQFATFTDEVGEACTSQLRVYTAGGGLHTGKDSEETAVNDTMREPGQPCGDSPTTIRQTYRNLNYYVTAITTTGKSLADLKEQTPGFLEDASASEAKEGVTKGATTTIGIGLIFGAIAMHNANRKQRGKETVWREFWQWYI